ncbi:MHYT domain-containing protein [Actinoplanes oblitus]|uniref:MHYT domain-containing protein n=1 Tax=Actinoplanes oblitus TaxID=3040509 RepID=A0ABY8WI34_9ACTN|nr:MHYT domain-containing protein [Actinoplanes oblitus]WIM97551.1 MHYT domain-containing protein [Actinoplanes oblitus]
MAAHVHHFTYGAFNPIAATLLAYLGSFLGLLCTARARDAHSRGRRNRWLVIAAFAIGGGGIWLMHFSAMLGFDVPDSPVRYDLPVTLLSLAFSVVTVGIGLMVVGHGGRSTAKTIAAGVLTGGGVLAMHYTGMEGMRVSARVHYNPLLVAASAVIALAACTIALWFTVSVRGLHRVAGASAVMAVAVCGMHYTGMAAMSVRMDPTLVPSTSGIRPLTMIVPITVLTAIIIVAVALSALQAMTEEEFTDGAGTPKRGVHAETPQPWTLRQPSVGGLRLSPAARAMAAGRAGGSARPSPGPRPAPRPPTFDPSVAGAPVPSRMTQQRMAPPAATPPAAPAVPGTEPGGPVVGPATSGT